MTLTRTQHGRACYGVESCVRSASKASTSDRMGSTSTWRCRLARDRTTLLDLTARLRTEGRASSLFDMRSYTRNFETALLDVWERWKSTAT